MFPDTVELLLPASHPRTYKKDVVIQPSLKYAIVRHYDYTTLGDDMRIWPDAVPVNDGARSGPGKGHAIPIYPHWWEYIRMINNDQGYKYTRSIGMLWINSQYDQDDPNPKPPSFAESIIGGGNFVAYDYETPTWIRLVSYHYAQDPDYLNPLTDNWYEKPWLFWYPVAVDKAGNFYKVGRAIDAFFPLIAYTSLWMHKSQVELFPAGYDYRLRGTDVYDGDQPLLTVTQDRVRHFHTSWRLNTVGVIPPVGWG